MTKKIRQDNTSLSTNKGFTLIEILVTASIMVVLGGGFLTLQYIVSKNQVSVYQNYLGVDEANIAISTMVREIRNARSGDNGAYPMESALDQQMVFYSDIDLDNLTEKVRYYLNGTSLYKGVINPTGTPATYPAGNEILKEIATNVRNGSEAIFYYYNGDWPSDTVNNPLPAPARLSETKLMKVYLKINPKANDPGNDFLLESYVNLRGLKTNL